MKSGEPVWLETVGFSIFLLIPMLLQVFLQLLPYWYGVVLSLLDMLLIQLNICKIMSIPIKGNMKVKNFLKFCNKHGFKKMKKRPLTYLQLLVIFLMLELIALLSSKKLIKGVNKILTVSIEGIEHPGTDHISKKLFQELFQNMFLIIVMGSFSLLDLTSSLLKNIYCNQFKRLLFTNYVIDIFKVTRGIL